MQVCPSSGQLVHLRRLLPEAAYCGPDEIMLGGCTCDSRRVEPGQLFAALVGTHHDGSKFIPEAIARGASAILVDRPLPESIHSTCTVPVCVVPNARDAFGRVCQALAGNPSRHMKVIGVTGTNGKTTTSCLLAGVFSRAGYKVGLSGTLGYFDGDDVRDATLTTPPADALARWLSRSLHNGCTHAVMEVSSHALDQSRVAGIRFDAGCITNVTRDHLDYHGTIQDYRLAKSKLLDHLPGEGLMVINADDPGAAAYLSQIDRPVLTVGMRSAAEITAMVIEQHVSEQTFLLTAGSDAIPVRTRMIGTHHVYNCLVAAAIGLAYGIDLPTIVRGLESTGHVPGRLERLECGQPFGVFIDYAHTPDALVGSLRALRSVTRGRLICVFGAGGDRDRQKRPQMAQAVESNADVAVVTSDNPRSEDPLSIIDEVTSGFRLGGRVLKIADRTEAICRALAEAQPGDCVLISGKGHEQEQIVDDLRIPMDDTAIAREWLYEFQPFAFDERKSA